MFDHLTDIELKSYLYSLEWDSKKPGGEELDRILKESTVEEHSRIVGILLDIVAEEQEKEKNA